MSFPSGSEFNPKIRFDDLARVNPIETEDELTINDEIKEEMMNDKKTTLKDQGAKWSYKTSSSSSSAALFNPTGTVNKRKRALFTLAIVLGVCIAFSLALIPIYILQSRQ
jgi:hypothetical protein